jgi:hypothetical protein
MHPPMLVTFGSITTTQSKVLRQTYRVLMIAFLLFVITAALPLNVTSPLWGHQLSSAILNASVLPWLALALARFGVTLQQREQLQARLAEGDPGRSAGLFPDDSEDQEEDDEASLVRDGDLRFLAQLGFWAMMLLAIWQLVLFGGTLSQIEGRQASEIQGIDQRFVAVQQRLKQLPADNQQQAFQQLGLGAPSPQEPKDPFARLMARRNQVKQQASQNANQARFLLTRESVRNLLLAMLYSTGFYGLARY